MRIGLLGGSFDPVHYGHLVIAEKTREMLYLDKIIFIPNFQNPLKEKKALKPKDRIAMLRLAIQNNPFFEISDYEIQKQTPSYTVDTLRYFVSLYPQTEFFWIVGSDVEKEIFEKWKEPQEILKMAKLVIYRRESSSDQEKIEEINNIIYLSSLFIPISSSLIRKYIQNKQSIKYLLPDAVLDYIIEKQLYQ